MGKMTALYDTVNILPLSMLSILIFGSYAGIPQRSLLTHILCAAFTLWMIALRNTRMKNRLRSIGAAAVFAAGLLLAAGEENRQAFLEEHLWVIWVLCFCLGSMAAGLIMDKSIWLRRAAALGLLGYCLAGAVISELGVGKEIFALICFVVLIRLTEEIQLRWKKSGFPDMREHITRTAPFIAALCLLVYLIPASAKPYGWDLAKALLNKTISYLSRLFGSVFDSSDDYGAIGFSDEGGFLSGLGSNDDEVLYITVDNSSVSDLRLVGCISGEFENCEWVFDTGSESSYRMTDTAETAAAVKKFASSRFDFIRGTEMTFETRFYNTRYIFAPAKIRPDVSEEKRLGISEKNGSLISEDRLGYEDTYRVSCYVLNQSNPELKELLDNAQPIGKSEWDEAVLAVGVSGREGLSYEDYQQYRRTVYEKFCRSYDISPETEEILDRIKNGSSGRYETAKRLEAFLQQMEYSTDCDPLPDSVTDAGSFLDYFLLNSRKGYCMHYSTAFVLMANAMGIPCRHVQG